MPKMLLVDGPAVAYRSHYALAKASLTTPDGRDVAATHGYTITLLKLLREENPDYACVAFDTKEPTYRHEILEEYKAGRPDMPAELAAQLEWIEAVTEGLGVRVLAVGGYEADDVIATLADKAGAAGIKVVIATGDKDMLQMVGEGIHVLMLSGSARDTKMMDRKDVESKYGIPPTLLPDYFGLMGDAVDNVKGVPGIGPKTAGKLVRQHGSLEEIYAGLADVAPERLRKILAENRDVAFRSRELVTVHRRVPLEVDIEDLRVGPHGGDEFRRLLRKLGFKRLSGQVFSEAKPVEVAPQVWQENDPALPKAAVAAAEVNLSGPSAVTSDILGIAVCLEDGGDYYFPLGHKEPGNVDRTSLERALRWLLAVSGVTRIAHDAKRVIIAFRRLGLDLGTIDFDTMLATYLVDPGRGAVSTDDIAADYLGAAPTGKRKGRCGAADATIRQASESCCRRGRVGLMVRNHLVEELRDKNLVELYNKLEIPLIQVLADMEMRGIRIDRGHLEGLALELDKRMNAAEKEAFALVGRPFNLNSTREVADVLFNEIGLKPRRKTKTGYSTDTGVLTELASEHELPGKILNYRQTAKLKSSHVDQLLDFADRRGDRIHACFHQSVTATGRLSSSDPNLQNVPIRGELGREIRKAFIPSRPDWVLISADYSQIELRVVAHLSRDPTLIDAFSKDMDIHASTAAFIFKVDPSDVTPSMRTVAKAVNFGIIYGMGPQALAKNTGLPLEEAVTFLKEHRDTYPGLYGYIEEMLAEARTRGWVETVLGRKRFIPGLGSQDSAVRSAAERMAVNTPVQGSAADIIKIAMLNIFAEGRVRNMAGGIVVQVHDEILVDCPEAEREAFVTLVRDKMSNAYSLLVPLKVEVAYGKNWNEAH